jgi:hypothetical protein
MLKSRTVLIAIPGSGLQFELLFLLWHDTFFSCSGIGMTMMNGNPKTG